MHFDSARLAFTPNSLKYLQVRDRRLISCGVCCELIISFIWCLRLLLVQEKTNRRKPLELHEVDESLDSSTHHASEARQETARLEEHRVDVPVVVNEPTEELPESVRAMQRGPEVIVEALHEIDALIANPPVHLNEPDDCRGQPGTSSVHDIVREYDLSLETGLPLSRTTDSWGDDPEDDPRDDPSVASPRAREPRSSTSSDTLRLERSERFAELDTIRESRFSSVSSSVEHANQQLFRITEECDSSISSVHTGETVPSSSRARHAADASESSAVQDAKRFVARASAGADCDDSCAELNQKSSVMQPNELSSAQQNGGHTPRKRSSGVRFSDGLRDRDSIDRPNNGTHRQTRLASPAKSRSDDHRHVNGHSERRSEHALPSRREMSSVDVTRDPHSIRIDAPNGTWRHDANRILPRKPVRTSLVGTDALTMS